jgi:hypothetical protein
MKSHLLHLIKSSNDRIDLYRAPRIAMNDAYDKIKNLGIKNLNVAIIALPCNGFGDVVFAAKFAKYIRYGLGKSPVYSTNVVILTPEVKMFEQLGLKDISLIKLNYSKYAQCRLAKNFIRPSNLPVQDVIFVAPLVADFNVNYSDIRGLLKESNPFNTLFLSEYNDNPNKNFDILTGVGKNAFGMLFDGEKPAPRFIKGPFALIYILKDFGIRYCASNFSKMIVKKYKKPEFQIIVQDWVGQSLAFNKTFIRYASQFYPQIFLKTKDSLESLTDETTGPKLIIRADIFPLKRIQMLSLMKYSVRDILLTGDQSITDTIDCCKNKTIWYQVNPWKAELARQLANSIPQKYLNDARKSCGSIKRMSFGKNSTTVRVKKQNDFRKKAKHLLDSTFKAISDSKTSDTLIYKYLNVLSHTRSINKLLEFVEK